MRSLERKVELSTSPPSKYIVRKWLRKPTKMM